jgi:hypothetical protein
VECEGGFVGVSTCDETVSLLLEDVKWASADEGRGGRDVGGLG